MISDAYIAGTSLIHKVAPSSKIVTLALFCTVVFLFNSWELIAFAGVLTLIAYKIAGIRLRHAYRSLKSTLLILLAIFIFQAFFSSLQLAIFILLRFSCLILAANLVTMTTKYSEFVEGIKILLRNTPSWVPADKIALAISLAIRFIPLVVSVFDEVRTAQRARGMDRSPVALLNPLIVRTLKTADQMSEAIRARSPEL